MRKPISSAALCSLLALAAAHITPSFSEAQSAPPKASKQELTQNKEKEKAKDSTDASASAPLVWWHIGVVCSDGFTTATGVVYLCADQQARPDVLSLQAASCASAVCSANGGFVADFALGAPSTTQCTFVNECSL